MAKTLLSFGLEKLWSLLVQESERLRGVGVQFNELESDVKMIRSFLEDAHADAKKYASVTVTNCMEEIKKIVFDAEDVIETFLLKEELGRTSGIKNRMRRLPFKIVDRRKLASDMEDISKRISKVVINMKRFEVRQIIADGRCSQPHQERQREVRHTFPSDNESYFVGLEQNVKKLVGYLVEEDSIQVVSICGMGGIGKTTLARQVFNHELVKNSFDGFAWVCVSQQCTRKHVWQTILQKLCSKHRDSDMTEDELQEKLFRFLETSKSLIVLDDMWKEEDWKSIKLVFPPTKGWKVLLTSRNEDVASRIDSTCVTLKPKCLTPEESWTLFRRIAFPREYTTELKVAVEMEEMGKKIIGRCGGLPLAIKVLGGLLAAQQTLSEWKNVYENVGSCLGGRTSFNDGNSSLVHQILSLSFEELPISLKQCFLYLAHFPEDYPIKVEDLAWYWAAEGILKLESESIRDVADIYIEDLVKRNMVMSERDVMTWRFETCQLHDMMRDVCLRKAKEEIFLQIVPGNSKTPCETRRIAVHWTDETFNVEGEMKNPKLRSLLFTKQLWGADWKASPLCFTRLQLVRTLDLWCAQFEGGKLPSNIGLLIHLRYLSLYLAHVSHLPSSMRHLKQLLYLNLDVSMGSQLYMPNFLKEMQELRFLSLPGKMRAKVKLELTNLVNLETLKNFSTKHSNVTDLPCMTRLSTLSIIINNKRCTMDSLSSSLGELRHLENLTIVDNTFMAREFVWDFIHLKHMSLSLYMPRLPDEQVLPSQLKTISLSWNRLEEDPMPVLEKMLHLYEVDLSVKSFCGRRMICSGGGFPQLRKLSFSFLDEWEEWIVEEGSMSLLDTLTFTNCEKLKELPDGLRFMTSLKHLTMGEEWKTRLSKGREDYYKVQHIPSVAFL